jgi:catechol 2,3-dioxygenase-like lactoylglutathione lyase family enzyme
MLKTVGMRHLALKVSDLARAKDFYMRVFGMRLVWQPDADNAYLSSGCDNLALHHDRNPVNRQGALDHLGFIAASLEDLRSGYEWVRSNSVDIVNPLRQHRDGSSSFYVKDPDGNLIQLLYEPSISPMRWVKPA